MKLTKAEKIWLTAVVIIYFLYNLPFFPAYYMPKATIIHMIVTIIPLWVAIYIGFFKICCGKKKKSEKSAGGYHPNTVDTDIKIDSVEADTQMNSEEDASC